MAAPINPCPFCSAQGDRIKCDLQTATGRWQIVCLACGARSGWLPSAQLAVDLWNTGDQQALHGPAPDRQTMIDQTPRPSQAGPKNKPEAIE